MVIAAPETFWTLLRDRAHWEFEFFLMALVDGLTLGLLWPFVRLHWRHHIDRDKRDGGIVPDRGPFIQHVPVRYMWGMRAVGRDGKPVGETIPMDPPKPKVTGPGYATRDKVIVGAYRAAERACEEMRQGCDKKDFACHMIDRQAILALTPQSAIDAAERDRREIADAALKLREQFEQATWEWNHAHYPEQPKPVPPTADDVLAKVGRGR